MVTLSKYFHCVHILHVLFYSADQLLIMMYTHTLDKQLYVRLACVCVYSNLNTMYFSYTHSELICLFVNKCFIWAL